jgi:hypothetical protein
MRIWWGSRIRGADVFGLPVWDSEKDGMTVGFGEWSRRILKIRRLRGDWQGNQCQELCTRHSVSICWMQKLSQAMFPQNQSFATILSLHHWMQLVVTGVFFATVKSSQPLKSLRM